MEHEEYLTIKEASAITKFTVGTLYIYVHEGRIPHFKKFGKLLFKRSELDAWMDEPSPKASKKYLITRRTVIPHRVAA